jgi:hypothetical protein
VFTDASWQLYVIAMEEVVVEGVKEVDLASEKAWELFM